MTRQSTTVTIDSWPVGGFPEAENWIVRYRGNRAMKCEICRGEGCFGRSLFYSIVRGGSPMSGESNLCARERFRNAKSLMYLTTAGW